MCGSECVCPRPDDQPSPARDGLWLAGHRRRGVSAAPPTTPGAHQGREDRADILAKKLPKRAWQQRSADNEAKGLRFYDWAMNLVGSGPGRHQLLLRRNRRTGELAFCCRYSGRRRPRGRSRSAGPPERHADRHPSARVLTRRMRRCRRGRHGSPVEEDITRRDVLLHMGGVGGARNEQRVRRR